MKIRGEKYHHYLPYVEQYQYDIVTQHGARMFETIREINLTLSNGTDIIIPTGYDTDLATIPPVLWSILPSFGKYTFAAIVHDYLYDNGVESKKFADIEFKHIMAASQVPFLRIQVMYHSVRVFGRGKFGQVRN